MGECLDHVLRPRSVRGEEKLLRAVNLLGLQHLARPTCVRDASTAYGDTGKHTNPEQCGVLHWCGNEHNLITTTNKQTNKKVVTTEPFSQEAASSGPTRRHKWRIKASGCSARQEAAPLTAMDGMAAFGVEAHESWVGCGRRRRRRSEWQGGAVSSFACSSGEPSSVAC